ncbi:MAG: Chromosomal replication initiator protein DnaA [Lentisphaerae bacterium ADurb.BinA184]|nr:MAG: Chromosomal replication initiator protein DnaA [Lentisphaerae bacterium ADurb.BinA184]
MSNDIFSEWLSTNYRDLILSAFAEASGMAVTLAFESGHEPADGAAAEADDASPAARRRPAPPPEPELPARFNRRFTFDTFVVGENNKFAQAACLAVAKTPGKSYNPLFMHGTNGLGKTHLLQAIAQDAFGRRKRARIEFLSSEEFANRYIDALRDSALPAFRRHFRTVDLLLIDDVHFFKGKEQFQEEFFHTFNALYNSHKQIVLTSDRPPHEIQGLEKRLVSRFEWGLTTEILPPDLETRVAILRKKQAEHEVAIGDDVLFFIASRVKSNIRRLEGALIRMVSYVSMNSRPMDVHTAEQLLQPILDEEAGSSVTVDSIQRGVAEFFDIRLADMTGKRRPANIALPRQVAMFLCRRLTDLSSPTIAEAFNRNHATILHAVGVIEKRLAKDAEFRNTLSKLERKLKG